MALQAHSLPCLALPRTPGARPAPNTPRGPWPSGFQLGSAAGTEGEGVGRRVSLPSRLLPSRLLLERGAGGTWPLWLCGPETPLAPLFRPSGEPRAPTILYGFSAPHPHFSNESSIKLCSNHPILGMPPASCWDPDGPREAE